MSELLLRFDHLIDEGGPSALILKEYLQPAAGEGGVIFPPTFAPPEGSAKDVQAGYVIDGAGNDNICLIDSVGSQANRIEPVFKQPKYKALVPQVEIAIGERKVNLLDVGHRVADALVRSTVLAVEVEQAFRDFEAGSATALAKVAPTSIVFGAWDSRSTQAKLPRLIDSTIRAYKVRQLERAAQYFSALEKEEVEELLGMSSSEKAERDLLSGEGFLDAPAGRTHGGVIAAGEIVRTAVVNLTALRALNASLAAETIRLRRYILGLTLLAASAPMDLFLRQGCLLVADPKKPSESELVYRDGRREPFGAALAPVEEYAALAAADFGVSPSRTVDFDPSAAKGLLGAKEKKKAEAKVKKEKKTAPGAKKEQ
ncbi:MAG: type I-U CRISPR-associated RAMP protein Csb1/Cas7u [Bryobacteraceae bacterium]